MDQQLRVTLRPATNAVTAKTFVWCGNQLCEERDSTGANVKKRFYFEGEQRAGGSDAGNYYYSRDHLGSIRELTDSTGVVKGRYDYDLWGNSSIVSGNMSVDFGYTGHYFHAPSGLNLSLTRPYIPSLGRWLSRDPIGESGGLNLYGYVKNSPILMIDRLGLVPGDWWDVRTPAYLSDQASSYAEGFRGKNGNDSDHHSIATRNFAERVEDVYGSRFAGTVGGFLAASFGNWAEASSPSDDWADDMNANMKGFWDYWYGNQDRSEPVAGQCP